jgi:hypothetical protein
MESVLVSTRSEKGKDNTLNLSKAFRRPEDYLV